MCVGVVEVLLLELEDADALLAVGFCFCGAVGVDAAFGEEVGASAGDNEGCPAVANSHVSIAGVLVGRYRYAALWLEVRAAEM